MIPFISRHRPQEAQKQTVRLAVGDDLTHDPAWDVIFSAEEKPSTTLAKAGIGGTTIAIVAPTWVQLALLREGYQLIEFVNFSSARARNVFLCRGLYVHTLDKSVFTKCPIPIAEQEESALIPDRKVE